MKIWRHKKRGSVVVEIGRGYAQAATKPIEEMAPVVVYSHNREFWVRTVDEFEDGRFEPIDDVTVDRLVRVDAALARQLSESIARNGKLAAENERLRAALRGMVDNFKPFTMRPIGGPGSAARLDQDAQTKAHADAVALLK